MQVSLVLQEAPTPSRIGPPKAARDRSRRPHPAPGGGGAIMSTTDADSLAAAVHDRLRQVQADGTAVVDALLAFMKERAALEEAYSRQLSKLSRHALALNGARAQRAARPPPRHHGLLRACAPTRAPAAPTHLARAHALQTSPRTRRSTMRSAACAATCRTRRCSTLSWRPPWPRT